MNSSKPLIKATNSNGLDWIITFLFGLTPLGSIAGFIAIFALLFAFWIIGVLTGQGGRVRSVATRVSGIKRASKFEQSIISRFPSTKENEFKPFIVGNHYSDEGTMTGWTTNDGKHFDREGNLLGWTASNGYNYNREGHIVGHIDKAFQHFDKDGNKIGWTNKKGRRFDRNGNMNYYTIKK